MSAVLDKDIAATLTPEELAAINEGPTEAEQAVIKRLTAEGGPDDEDDDDADADGDPDETLDADGKPVDTTGSKPAEGAAAAASDKDGAKAGPVAEAAALAADAAPAASAPAQAQPIVYKAALPADYDQRVADLKTKTEDLRARFKAGEIDLEAFDAENAQLQTERDELGRAATKAEISQEMSAQSAETAWRNEIEALFTRSKASGGPDYATDEAVRDDLDGFVKALAANDKNADKPMAWFLDEAHKRVLALHDIKPSAAPAKDADKNKPADAVKSIADKRKPNVAAVPATLAHVPGGDSAGDVAGDEFAELDSLQGQALEDAIARMTPAQRAKYVQG